MIGNANWFEIPTLNFERAVMFYQAAFQVSLKRENMGGEMAMFPGSDGVGSGALVAPQDGYTPGNAGPVVYLDAGGDLQHVLTRAEQNGGTTLLPKTALPEGMGFFAHLQDSEGNRVGLHSMA